MTQEQLLRHIPNEIASVEGEKPYLDKLAPFLETAEKWFHDTFISDELIPDSMRDTADALIVSEAYRTAIPQLNIVLTPNGFATVGTQDLVPASAQRTQALIESLADRRDSLIHAILLCLPAVEGWPQSSQASFFAESIFPDLAVTDMLGVQHNRWEKYLEIRPQILDIEHEFAVRFISPELMTDIRTALISAKMNHDFSIILKILRQQVIMFLKSGTFAEPRLMDAVEYIRRRPEIFPQWHASDTFNLFSPPVFRNKKKSPGYFF